MRFIIIRDKKVKRQLYNINMIKIIIIGRERERERERENIYK